MKWKPFALSLAGVFVSYLGIRHANGLLETKTLNGTEYVWLTATYLATGMLIAILSKITELSFSSLTLKLTAAEKAAEVTLEQLERALELSFIPAISSVIEFPGGFSAGGPRDERLLKFFTLADAIDKAGLRNRFAPELAEAARTIARSQLRRVGDYNSEFLMHRTQTNTLPTPAAVRIEAVKAKGISDSAAYQDKSEHELLSLVNEAVDAYAEIYAFTL